MSRRVLHPSYENKKIKGGNVVDRVPSSVFQAKSSFLRDKVSANGGN